MMKTFLAILLFSLAGFAYAQPKEVYIIGTMHTVPPIVKNSYKPLLKRAIAYKPEAILTEDIMPADTMSLRLFTPRFLSKAEESLKSDPVDDGRVSALLNQELSTLSSNDFQYLSKAFLQHKDRANYAYYDYLATYGLKGSSKPLRNESDDVTHKLAIAMGIRQLLPIDSHHNDREYNQTVPRAKGSGSDNGDLKRYYRLYKKNNRRMYYYALTGRLGLFTNKRSTLQYYYNDNSVRYVEHPNALTEQAGALWDDRNDKMARNILWQMDHSEANRFLLIVGAGHVISLENALHALRPEVSVKTIYME